MTQFPQVHALRCFPFQRLWHKPPWWAGRSPPALMASAAGEAWCVCRGGFVFPVLITFSCCNLARCGALCVGWRQIHVLLSYPSQHISGDKPLLDCSPKELKSLKALLFWCGGQWAEVEAKLITAEASSSVPLPPRSENSFEERMRRGNHRAAFQMLS